ncbi:uncharacterized protein BDR25DRAFT_359073 [Lindgomyces ingoldianus]|uniref:Uncharacterized protein n=1 Tax=Lindgomyces ingoldianus TaxID=673940 RepID=A0ACB6QL32_9PLEO|nr:uncharacterized protein BDR25DRAFT_359073 [Lindgomyces ingoldianus]KAF2467022.1 hypothetical protein BDR25DRAFT_359073 [Lindgomyces ingoldianus]
MHLLFKILHRDSFHSIALKRIRSSSSIPYPQILANSNQEHRTKSNQNFPIPRSLKLPTSPRLETGCLLFQLAQPVPPYDKDGLHFGLELDSACSLFDSFACWDSNTSHYDAYQISTHMSVIFSTSSFLKAHHVQEINYLQKLGVKARDSLLVFTPNHILDLLHIWGGMYRCCVFRSNPCLRSNRGFPHLLTSPQHGSQSGITSVYSKVLNTPPSDVQNLSTTGLQVWRIFVGTEPESLNPAHISELPISPLEQQVFPKCYGYPFGLDMEQGANHSDTISRNADLGSYLCTMHLTNICRSRLGKPSTAKNITNKFKTIRSIEPFTPYLRGNFSDTVVKIRYPPNHSPNSGKAKQKPSKSPNTTSFLSAKCSAVGRPSAESSKAGGSAKQYAQLLVFVRTCNLPREEMLLPEIPELMSGKCKRKQSTVVSRFAISSNTWDYSRVVLTDRLYPRAHLRLHTSTKHASSYLSFHSHNIPSPLQLLSASPFSKPRYSFIWSRFKRQKRIERSKSFSDVDPEVFRLAHALLLFSSFLCQFWLRSSVVSVLVRVISSSCLRTQFHITSFLNLVFLSLSLLIVADTVTLALALPLAVANLLSPYWVEVKAHECGWFQGACRVATKKVKREEAERGQPGVTLYSLTYPGRISLLLLVSEKPPVRIAKGYKYYLKPNASRKWAPPISAAFHILLPTTSTVGMNRRGTQGKLYTIKTQAACKKEGIAYAPLPKGVAGHVVVFATIASNPCGDARYYPIAPTARSPYSFQLHLRHYNNQFIGPPSALPLYSYLRVEEHVTPLEMLVGVKGDFGEHLMLKNESVDKLVSALRTK